MCKPACRATCARGTGPLPTAAGRGGNPIRLIDKPSLLHNRQAVSEWWCQNSTPLPSSPALRLSFLLCTHTHTHTPSSSCSISPSVLLFHPSMDVKPVIPIRRKEPITALVLMLVEWLMVCVLCVLCQLLSPLSLLSSLYFLLFSFLLDTRCVLSICYHGAKGAALHLLGDSKCVQQVCSILGNTNTLAHTHAKLLTHL